MFKTIFMSLILVFGLSIFGQSVSAQATGIISGRVTTSEGQGIPGARMTLVNESGATTTIITNPLGYYSFSVPIPPISYILSCSHKEYTFSVNNPRTLAVTENVTANFVADSQKSASASVSAPVLRHKKSLHNSAFVGRKKYKSNS